MATKKQEKAGKASTLYEYYDNTVINEGLQADGTEFVLNGKQIKIISGAFHYFRVHPDYWRITIRKMKAAGLNTVETYVPWNLHNPRQGVYDFGDLGEDMSPFVDIRKFIQLIQEEDMFLIFRPGPYICSEWEFGGLPSWLLRDPAMKVRSSYPGFLNAVEAYFEELLTKVYYYQFVEGGPIIAIQIENEFGHFGYDDYLRDINYMKWQKDLLDTNGFERTLYFTSDSPNITGDYGALPGILQTANFQSKSVENLESLLKYQPNRPILVTEYWTGWFDHWLSKFHITLTTPDEFESILSTIFTYNGSVNFYMFIGGTNFGFMAGANVGGSWVDYSPDTTSYDYDAPLTEAGDYNSKYSRAKAVIKEYDPLHGIIGLPDQPSMSVKGDPGTFPVDKELDFESLVEQAPVSVSLTDGPINMEALDVNDGNGQSYGYTLYSTTLQLPAGTSTLLIRGHVRDMAQLIVNGDVITSPYSIIHGLSAFGFWGAKDASITFDTDGGSTKIQILVENLGRVNFGKPHFFDQRKGLYEGPVYVNDVEIKDWAATPFEFKSSYINNLVDWTDFTGTIEGPAAYHSIYTVAGTPKDVWFEMKAWNKGVVFVNGFNIGRYWNKDSPVTTLYVPAPLIKEGNNNIVIFEQYEPSAELTVTNEPSFSLEIDTA